MKVYEGSEKYIFVSYCHKDEEKVLPMIRHLQNQGFRIWYDGGIEVGAEWPEYIAEHLEACDSVLAFISKAAVESKNCREEINFARELDKNILIIYLEEVKLTPGMRMRIGSLHAMFSHHFDSLKEFQEKLAAQERIQSCLREIKKKTEVQKKESIQVEDYITFGHYEQDNNKENGLEEIRWKVLDKQGDEFLIISEKCLDAIPYHDEWGTITWENCTLRKWLNNEFYHTAFTKYEKQQISSRKIQNLDNPYWNTKGGADTNDNIFLLSIEETKKYFSSDEEREAVATDYAKAQGCYAYSGDNTAFWWLRSPGNSIDKVAFVHSSGNIDSLGRNIYYTSIGVRPALWIKA